LPTAPLAFRPCDADKRISALQFALPFKDGHNIAFSLPCEWRRFQQVLKNQNVRRWDEDEYAYRVAWANIRDWVASQMVLYETEMVDMPQIFLPFAVGKDDKTLYEQMHMSRCRRIRDFCWGMGVNRHYKLIVRKRKTRSQKFLWEK
jgi:hypothetical protein